MYFCRSTFKSHCLLDGFPRTVLILALLPPGVFTANTSGQIHTCSVTVMKLKFRKNMTNLPEELCWNFLPYVFQWSQQDVTGQCDILASSVEGQQYSSSLLPSVSFTLSVVPHYQMLSLLLCRSQDTVTAEVSGSSHKVLWYVFL